MDIHNFFPAQEPQPEELDAGFVDTTVNLANRMLTLTQPGIVPADKLFAETGDDRWDYAAAPFLITKSTDRPLGAALCIDVAGGIAYDPANERIAIALDAADTYDLANITLTDSLGNLIPKSTGNYGMLLPNASTCHVYVRYLHAVDSSTPGGEDPVNNYTVDPATGQLDYVARIDGYHLHYTVSPAVGAADDVYLGTVVTAGGVVTAIHMDGTAPGILRTFANISSALVKAHTPAIAGAVTAVYAADQVIDLSEHVNAVADAASITPENPHGTIMSAIPGLVERFGPYSDNPSNFTANCLVDRSADPSAPGPFWADYYAPLGNKSVRLQLPTSEHFAYLDGLEYLSTAAFYSEVKSGAAIIPQLATTELICQFPDGVGVYRETGFYYVCLQRYAPPVGDPGLLAHAYTTPTLAGFNPSLPADVEQVLLMETTAGASLLPNIPGIIPVAVVYFDKDLISPGVGGFRGLTDPQTGIVLPSPAVIDVRHFGHIDSDQIFHERRHYPTVGYELSTNITNLRRNLRILKKDLEVYGNAAGGTEGGNIKVLQGSINLSGSFVASDDANITVKNRVDPTDTSSVFLPGELKTYAGATAPAGWLFANGAQVSSITYPRLWSVLQTTYGPGSAGTTVTLPDLRGRVPVGLDNMGGVGAAGRVAAATVLGQASGAEAVTLTSAQSGLRDHAHSSAAVSNLNVCTGCGYPASYGPAETGGVTGGALDALSSHTNMPPYLAINYIIKT